jgi:signal transduction histidine kinase/CheY-like chemotaxis protein/HAMP domain-containing protein
MALRRHLVILAALTLLPLIVFTTWTVLEMHREERARVERSLTATARALSLAVDGELTAAVTALEGLATSSDLDTGNFRAFHAQATTLRQQRPGWTTIALDDPDGTEILNVLRPLGTRLALTGKDPEDIRRVASSGQPVIGDAFVGPLSGLWVIGVHVPVVRVGKVRYVLSTTIHTHDLRDVLLDQRLPKEWIGTILDRKRIIVARTHGEEKFVGQPASERLLAASAQASEGWYRGLTKEGTSTYSAFSRSPRTGMTVALGVPAGLIEAPLARSLWRLAGSGALALALGIAVAVFFARRIARPITTLAVTARDIGRGTAPRLPTSPITEVNALQSAMAEAARGVRDELETLETIARTGQLLSGELSLERLVQGVTDACTRLCRAAFGVFVSVTGERGDTPTLSAISGVPREAFAGFPLPRGAELFGPTFRDERVVRIDDVTVDPRYATSPPFHGLPSDHTPVRSYLAVSVVSRAGEVVGGLFFGHPEPGVFTEREEALVRGLAPHIATAIDNARLYERQQAARAEAEAANTLKDEFLATLSHELRTPLNAVLGWARMLKTSSLDEATAKRAIDVIERNAHAQMQLIEDLLDVSRIIAGKLRLDVKAVSPAAVIEAAVDALRPAAEAKAIRLQPVLDPRAGPVSGDPDRLQQVVWNLLSNAVKFTPRGGRVQIRLVRVNSHVEIVVTDTGKGIAADVLPFVFDRFRQADSSSQRAYGGLGIGLALVKNLVELHGGSVQAVSPGPDQGATVTVKLPLMLHAETAERGQAALHGMKSTTSLGGITLLILDDDTDALDLFATVLRQAGGEVRAARSAGEALDLLRAWEPDVIVSDIEMPGENGYAFIRRLRSGDIPHGDRIPAIAVTAYGGVNERIRVLSAGFDAYVAKPVEPDELAAIIGRMVARARTARRAREE